MPTTASTLSVTDRIQGLLDDRQQLAEAIAAIDKTLEQVNALLGAPPGSAMPAWQPTSKLAMAATPTRSTAKRRGRKQFAMTGEQSILAFIKARRNPTTREVNAQWKQEGRGGTADSLLSEMAKAKKLRKKPLGGRLGSEYSLASTAAAFAAMPSSGQAKTRKRRTYATTAEDLILSFVKEKTNPTTQEIKKLWDSEGRKGKADNELTRLVHFKKLERTPLVGERGSRYSIP